MVHRLRDWGGVVLAGDGGPTEIHPGTPLRLLFVDGQSALTRAGQVSLDGDRVTFGELAVPFARVAGFTVRHSVPTFAYLAPQELATLVQGVRGGSAVLLRSEFGVVEAVAATWLRIVFVGGGRIWTRASRVSLGADTITFGNLTVPRAAVRGFIVAVPHQLPPDEREDRNEDDETIENVSAMLKVGRTVFCGCPVPGPGVH